MIGFHYTTWEAYQLIQETGLHLSPLPKQHEEKCSAMLEFIEDGCVWVYPERMCGSQQVGQVFFVAIRHDCHHIVCLEVDYPEWHSATHLVEQKYENDGVHVTHDLFGAGPFNHTRKRFDLITQPVPPEQIQMVGEWNLPELIQQGERQLMEAT